MTGESFCLADDTAASRARPGDTAQTRVLSETAATRMLSETAATSLMTEAVSKVATAAGALLADRYRVVRQLGHGGMGSVWLAEDTKLDNRRVALKMLPPVLVSDSRAYNQLKAEALVSLKLVHPNIVQLRAFEENAGSPFLVMDYIEGTTLSHWLGEKKKLSEAETVKLLAPIAAALDYAHGEGVVHRDVKPANVMIRTDGKPFKHSYAIAAKE